MSYLVSVLLAVSILQGACVAFVHATAVEADKAAELSREIREHFRQSGFNWVSPVMYATLNKQTNTKPNMFFFTSRSCSDCRELMEAMKRGDHTANSGLSSQFNAVLVLDDYSLDFGLEYAPNGNDYTPRILFADPDGKLRYEFKNPRADADAPYFYSSLDEVVSMMGFVLTYYRDRQGCTKYPAGLNADLPS